MSTVVLLGDGGVAVMRAVGALLAVGGLDGSAVVVAAAAAAGSEQGDGEGGKNGLIFPGGPSWSV